MVADDIDPVQRQRKGVMVQLEMRKTEDLSFAPGETAVLSGLSGGA